jgi:hypothetical protein
LRIGRHCRGRRKGRRSDACGCKTLRKHILTPLTGPPLGLLIGL